MSTPENFAKEPVSIAELRAEKSMSNMAWKPRDALIQVLRMIDDGTIDPKDLIIGWSEVKATETQGVIGWRCGYRSASTGELKILGLIEAVKFKVMEPD